MGTHPIFESDFDCLTDDAETVSWSHCGNSQCRFMRQYRFDWAVVHGREWNVKSVRSKSTCVKDNTVVGISYAHCNNDHIPHDDDLANVTWIDFRQAECTYSDKDT